MNALHIIPLLALIACTSSCDKKKEDKAVKPNVSSPPLKHYDNYATLNPGNYWVYYEYTFNTTTSGYEPTGQYDSCYVEKDTLINGKQYHKYCRYRNVDDMTSINYLRDSLSYIVNLYGGISFSSEDFTTVFRTYTIEPGVATPDTISVTEKMIAKNVSVTVDAGTFVTYEAGRIFRYPAHKGMSDVVLHTSYAKNIGIVKMQTAFYYQDPSMIFETHLVRYKVQ